MPANIVLINPKYGENVGGCIRACLAFEADGLFWTGQRVLPSRRVRRRARIEQVDVPVEPSVSFDRDDQAVERLVNRGAALVAVEIFDDGEDLALFDHPHDACYIFGPEDGSLPRDLTHRANRRVTIPSARSLNLAAVVNVVLYDRTAKGRQAP